MKRFIEPYKIKRIVLLNAVELKLLATIKIHLVVNVSRIQQYVGKVEEQKREQPTSIVIEGEKE